MYSLTCLLSSPSFLPPHGLPSLQSWDKYLVKSTLKVDEFLRKSVVVLSAPAILKEFVDVQLTGASDEVRKRLVHAKGDEIDLKSNLPSGEAFGMITSHLGEELSRLKTLTRFLEDMVEVNQPAWFFSPAEE